MTRFRNSWTWAAFGKHPALKDFFSLGIPRQAGQGFAEWVQSGYQRASARENKAPRRFYSWRFWMKGPRKGSLACGLLRDSSDSLGRPFPLLIVGSGSLPGWEERWELLPLACERPWEQMEAISTGAFPDFDHLKEEIRQIQPPRPQWSEFSAGKFALAGDGSGDCWAFESGKRTIGAADGDLIPLDDPAGGSPRAAVQLWHSLWKQRVGDIPRVIFMGGNGNKVFVAFFRQPLTAEDFGRLWSA